MKITEHRTKEILNWLDDHAADHALMFEEMTLFRDAASLVRQLQADEQAAWHAGLDAGREQGRGKHAHQPPSAPVGVERKYPDDGNGDDDAYNRGWNDCLDALTQQPAAVDEAMERTKWRCAFCGGVYYLPIPSGRFCCDAQAKFHATQPLQYATVAEEALRDQEAMNGPAEAAASQTED